jgi:hypothetical protein
MGLNYDKPGTIYAEMLTRRRPVPGIFSGSAKSISAFVAAMGQP